MYMYTECFIGLYTSSLNYFTTSRNTEYPLLKKTFSLSLSLSLSLSHNEAHELSRLNVYLTWAEKGRDHSDDKIKSTFERYYNGDNEF